jgi:hypothetical protein
MYLHVDDRSGGVTSPGDANGRHVLSSTTSNTPYCSPEHAPKEYNRLFNAIAQVTTPSCFPYIALAEIHPVDLPGLCLLTILLTMSLRLTLKLLLLLPGGLYFCILLPHS